MVRRRNLIYCLCTCVKLNLCCLPHQTVSDIERGWILVNKDQHRQLKSLQEKGSKKEVSRSIFLDISVSAVQNR